MTKSNNLERFIVKNHLDFLHFFKSGHIYNEKSDLILDIFKIWKDI